MSAHVYFLVMAIVWALVALTPVRANELPGLRNVVVCVATAHLVAGLGLI